MKDMEETMMEYGVAIAVVFVIAISIYSSKEKNNR